MNPYKSRIEHFLKTLLSQASVPSRLDEAIAYSVLNGGKRLRPALVYATGEIFNAPLECLDAPAAAMECMHCYSLVHDDLPAMDDDDLRRGQATCHKQYDEATAILVGDALQSLAFEILCQSAHPAELKIKMLYTLSKASGREGMVAGQAMDLAAEGKHLSLEQVLRLHALKTGALFRASIRLGALAGNADEKSLKILDEFADLMGLAFQIQDDILDLEGESEILGKPVGSDLKFAKATFPGLVGLWAAKEKVKSLQEKALNLLEAFSDRANRLRNLSVQLTQRNV